MRYSESHEWVKIDGKKATIGVTNYAQKELGDIVYVELPDVGREVKAEEEAVVLESTKAAADVYSPVSGKILAVNQALEGSPDRVNLSPEQDGWLFEVEMTEPEEVSSLMEEQDYKDFVK